ncbi:alpha/beta hydrolase [Streptococcus constellatus]|uniref:alpha/beta hydrolase n=1 Tax=Streptococcus constellatus TaxID=76860 RepID=UPI0006608D2B|nr:alpha/beta hydrolase [Streptococcus constellatus]
MKAYFIGGLGCNRFYPQDFFDSLHFPVVYLDMYDSKLKERLTSLQALKDWFVAQVDMEDDILLIAHSLGADLAVYLTSVYDNIMHLVLLDGGYIDMDKICPLNVEIEDALNYLQTNTYRNLEGAIIAEKQNATVWSENIERAVKKSFVFDEVQRYWHLNLSEILLTRLLTIRRQTTGKLSLLQNRNVILFIPRVNQSTPIRKQNALKNIPDFIDILEVSGCGHSLYTEKPKEIAALLRDKIDTNRLFDKKET